jgi:hypothetical protein
LNAAPLLAESRSSVKFTIDHCGGGCHAKRKTQTRFDRLGGWDYKLGVQQYVLCRLDPIQIIQLGPTTPSIRAWPSCDRSMVARDA